MPNWVECTLKAKGPIKDIQSIIALVETKEEGEVRAFDLNGISLSPAALSEIVIGSTRINSEAVHAWREGENGPVAVTAEETATLKAELGASDWREWAIDNWGCKWNASESDRYGDGGNSETWTFQTPWSPPLPALDKLASMFPAVEFYLRAVDEGGGFDGGIFWNRGKRAGERDFLRAVSALEWQNGWGE